MKRRTAKKRAARELRASRIERTQSRGRNLDARLAVLVGAACNERLRWLRLRNPIDGLEQTKLPWVDDREFLGNDRVDALSFALRRIARGPWPTRYPVVFVYE